MALSISTAPLGPSDRTQVTRGASPARVRRAGPRLQWTAVA
jgi:hypothetical protein